MRIKETHDCTSSETIACMQHSCSVSDCLLVSDITFVYVVVAKTYRMQKESGSACLTCSDVKFAISMFDGKDAQSSAQTHLILLCSSPVAKSTKKVPLTGTTVMLMC